MLTQQEKDFVRYWELNREREGRWPHQLLSGLPLGICFGVPVLISFIFRSWYKWLPYVSNDELLFIAIGVLCIILFYAFFRSQFMWDRKQQQYLEIKAREARDSHSAETEGN
jgi:hypothetical protein